ncbi:hypothetical protein AAFF_G00341640 [Aldrovandia affinis]|uniref:Uncharacterized protein n=1 Tax=Aldrovandia affinis TaxID=143900 RepID=A0AAD7SMT9_9TELE|nr:hypothetical protein AAFF_G00341640 [Aldrovandia affinis]
MASYERTYTPPRRPPSGRFSSLPIPSLFVFRELEAERTMRNGRSWLRSRPPDGSEPIAPASARHRDPDRRCKGRCVVGRGRAELAEKVLDQVFRHTLPAKCPSESPVFSRSPQESRIVPQSGRLSPLGWPRESSTHFGGEAYAFVPGLCEMFCCHLRPLISGQDADAGTASWARVTAAPKRGLCRYHLRVSPVGVGFEPCRRASLGQTGGGNL